MQMQAKSILLLLAALMPAASLLAAQTPSPRHLVRSFGKKKPATARRLSHERCASAPKKKPKTEDEPGLARPWDTDDTDENATRAQKRGGKIGNGRGERGELAPRPVKASCRRHEPPAWPKTSGDHVRAPTFESMLYMSLTVIRLQFGRRRAGRSSTAAWSHRYAS